MTTDDDVLADRRPCSKRELVGLLKDERLPPALEAVRFVQDKIEQELRETSGRRADCGHGYCEDHGDGDCLYDEETP